MKGKAKAREKDDDLDRQILEAKQAIEAMEETMKLQLADQEKAVAEAKEQANSAEERRKMLVKAELEKQALQRERELAVPVDVTQVEEGGATSYTLSGTFIDEITGLRSIKVTYTNLWWCYSKLIELLKDKGNAQTFKDLNLEVNLPHPRNCLEQVEDLDERIEMPAGVSKKFEGWGKDKKLREIKAMLEHLQKIYNSYLDKGAPNGEINVKTMKFLINKVLTLSSEAVDNLKYEAWRADAEMIQEIKMEKQRQQRLQELRKKRQEANAQEQEANAQEQAAK